MTDSPRNEEKSLVTVKPTNTNNTENMCDDKAFLVPNTNLSTRLQLKKEKEA